MLTETSAQALLNHAFGNTAYSAPATLYLALFSASPGRTGGGTELSGNGYARVAITNSSAIFPAASSSTKTNATSFSFPQATAAWATATFMGLFDASTGGTLLLYSPVSGSNTAATGDVVRFNASTWTLSMDNA